MSRNPFEIQPWDNHDHYPPKQPYKAPSKVDQKPATIYTLFPNIDRWSFGYSDLLEALHTQASQTNAPSYPPYNITKYNDGMWEIEMAVAGFDKESLDIFVEDRVLTIKSIFPESEEEPKKFGEVVHKGIAKRAFKTTFLLAEHVKVKNAKLEDGLLTVSLLTDLPEEKKPKQIEIS